MYWTPLPFWVRCLYHDTPEYAFALCSLGAWPFTPIMNEDILLEDFQGSTLPAEEDLQEDPTTTRPPTETLAPNKKHHCKCKGKSKNRDQSESAGATSNASKVSHRCASQASHQKVYLVQQDLQLSSDWSDPDGAVTTTKDHTGDAIGDSGFTKGSTWWSLRPNHLNPLWFHQQERPFQISHQERPPGICLRTQLQKAETTGDRKSGSNTNLDHSLGSQPGDT